MSEEDRYCQYCGDEMIRGKRGFKICGWCLLDIEEGQKKIKKMSQPNYFNGNRDEYTEEVEYG